MKRASPAEPAAPAASPPDRGAYRVWLWVGAIFVFMALLWAAMFTAAREARIESVPLATKGGPP